MGTKVLSFLKNPQKVFWGLLIIDGILLVAHLLFGQGNHFFHLDFENNLPTYYQSGKLIFFGAAFCFLGITRKISREMRFFLISLAVFMVALGFDELLQIHENIYRIFSLFDWLHPSRLVEASMRLGYRSSLWILYYLPFILIFVFWSGYWLHYFQARLRRNFLAALSSSLLLFTVLIMEVMSSTGRYSETEYFWMVTIEEVAEMLFASVLVFVGLRLVKKYLRLLR